MSNISGSSRVYLTVGHPTNHVRATGAVNNLFREHGVDAVAVAADVAPEDLGAFFQGARGWHNLLGFGLSIPHKEAAAGLVDELDATAARVRAVNTVRRTPDGRLVGAIFDGTGLVDSLRTEGYEPASQPALIVGAGGAGRAVAFALAEAGVPTLAVANRSRARADKLAGDLRRHFPHLDVSVENKPDDRFGLVFNGTSLGMHADDSLPIDLSELRPGTVVADAVMSPELTPLLCDARARGLTPHFGKAMFGAQLEAIASFLQF